MVAFLFTTKSFLTYLGLFETLAGFEHTAHFLVFVLGIRLSPIAQNFPECHAAGPAQKIKAIGE